MILLNDVARKLQGILDGTDSEAVGDQPTDFQFVIKTAGFHLDANYDRQTGKNFIPVFISSLGGEYNPVPQLKEQRQSIGVNFYYPVRFKDDFESLFEYLANNLVGKYLTFRTTLITLAVPAVAGTPLDADEQPASGVVYYTRTESSAGAGFLNDGTYKYTRRILPIPTVHDADTYFPMISLGSDAVYENRKAVTNLSIAQFGEIQEIDLKQFKDWVGSVYRETIDTNEPYMSMSFTIFLLHAGEDFVYGNEAQVSLTISNGITTHIDANVVFPDASVQSNSEPAAQQLIGANIPETEGIPVHTSYSSGFTCYIKNNQMYKDLLFWWFHGDSQKIQCLISIGILGRSFVRIVYIQSVNLNIQKGQLATITFAFAKKKAS